MMKVKTGYQIYQITPYGLLERVLSHRYSYYSSIEEATKRIETDSLTGEYVILPSAYWQLVEED